MDVSSLQHDHEEMERLIDSIKVSCKAGALLIGQHSDTELCIERFLLPSLALTSSIEKVAPSLQRIVIYRSTPDVCEGVQRP